MIVLDNSIRESTVGQLRGHTLENKWKIYNQVKKCGFKFIVVAAFSHMTRVDDTFIEQIVAKGEDVNSLFAFTEVIESVKNGIPDTKSVPVGLSKMKALGLVNPIIAWLPPIFYTDFNIVNLAKYLCYQEAPSLTAVNEVRVSNEIQDGGSKMAECCVVMTS